MNTSKNAQKIRRMVILSVFAALAYVVMLAIHIKVPPFLTMDVKDTVITLCGLYFGPLGALIIAVLIPLLEFVTISDTGVYGLMMNTIGSVAFSVTASLIYKYKKTLFGAIVGLASAAFVMTGVMMLANLLITPHYMSVSVDDVRALIPQLLFPFNLIKAVLNVGLVLLFYKQIGIALRKAGFLPRKAPATTAEWDATLKAPVKRFKLRTALVLASAVILIAVSMVVIFVVLGGTFGFGR